MELAEKLDSIEQIKTLKARYFRFVDTKQFPALQALFTADARFDTAGSGMEPCDGPAAFVAQAQASLTGCVSVHHGHCPEIEVTSDTTATGVWAMEDMLRWDETTASPVRSVHGMGHYFEDYRRVDGEWKIASWKLTRLRVDVVPA